MLDIVNRILGFGLSFVVPVFYKRIQGRNIENLQVKGPVVIAMNHPNAFTDPVVINLLTRPKQGLRYLARGDAFKPGLITWFLEQVGIIPIFRIQDAGREGLAKNQDTYRRVNYYLSKNAKIIIFAEGLCIQEKRLRPLKKGVPRMVFLAHNELKNKNLIVVPVGVNYSQPDKLRSTIFYNVGEPIAIKDYDEQFKQNEARTYNSFLQLLEPKMKELIIHINNKKYDRTFEHFETLVKRDWLKQQKKWRKDLYEDFLMSQIIVGKLNTAEINNLELLNEFHEKSEIYFQKLNKNKLKDWLINPLQNNTVNGFGLAIRVILLLVGLPFHAIGFIGNIIPFKLVHFLTKKLVKKNKEFYSSIAIALAMVLFLINYLLLFFISYAYSPNVWWPVAICVSTLLFGRFSISYRELFVKSLGILRILKNKALANNLSKEREYLLSLINRF